MTKNKEAGQEAFLVQLDFLMKLSVLSYSKYRNNKIYLHALNIRRYNQKIYDLIMGSIEIIPAELGEDFRALLNHYDCWMLQFSEEEGIRKPMLKDQFVFERADEQIAFPQAAEARIFEAAKFNKEKQKI